MRYRGEDLTKAWPDALQRDVEIHLEAADDLELILSIADAGDGLPDASCADWDATSRTWNRYG